MTQQFNQTIFPAPTADTEAGPEFHYSDGELLLSFRDYRNNDVRIRFRNVLGIRWTEDDGSGHGLRDDKVYEVRDSDWIRKLQDLGAIPSANHGYRHLKIGFNELGSFLDVVFKGNEQME